MNGESCQDVLFISSSGNQMYLILYFLPIYFVADEIFHWISEKFDLLVVQCEQSSYGDHKCMYMLFCQSIHSY